MLELSPARAGSRETVKRPHQARTSIVEAARTVLRDESYLSLSMDMVAAASRLTRRTVYNHFATKDVLYRACRTELIHELAALVVDEVPADMTSVAGLRTLADRAYAVFASETNVEIARSIVRDGLSQPWLAVEYGRYVRAPLIRACENFMLLRLRRAERRPVSARNLAEQFVSVVDALATGPQIFPGICMPSDPPAQQLAALARSYAAKLDGGDSPAA